MYNCVSCNRIMSRSGICSSKRCSVDTVPAPVFNNNSTTQTIIELAINALGSENAALLVRPIPMYFTHNWIVDYEILKNIAKSLLQKLRSYVVLSDEERYMYNWLMDNKMQLGLISSYNCLGLQCYGFSLKFIEVTNTDAKQDEFKARCDGTYGYLYHGSIDQHWYYIIKNGLRNMSKTVISNNGECFGNGIYCTDDWQHALVYCKNTIPRIICAVQTTKNPHIWERGIGIFVVPDDRDLIVRYLIIIEPSAKL